MTQLASITNEDDTYQMYVFLTRDGDTLRVRIGVANAEIKYNGSVYILSKNSEIYSRVDENNSDILELKRNLIKEGLLPKSSRNPQLLITNSKIRCQELIDLFDFIIGTHCQIPYANINDLENKQSEFSISLQKETNESTNTTEIPSVSSAKKSRKRKIYETMDVITSRHQQQGRSWHVYYGQAHSVITLVRKQNRKYPDRLLLYFQIQKGSTILKNDEFLCAELQEARKKLLAAHTLIADSYKPSLLKLTENITLAHFTQVFPFITGYDAIAPQHVADIFPETEQGVRLRFSLPTGPISSQSSGTAGENQDTGLYLSFAFMKNEDNSLTIASKNAVADVKFANNVYQILPDSTVISSEFSVSSLAIEQKNMWLETGAVECHPEDETLLFVKSKLRSTSLDSVFEIITGFECHLPFSSIDDMPEMFEFDSRSE